MTRQKRELVSMRRQIAKCDEIISHYTQKCLNLERKTTEQRRTIKRQAKRTLKLEGKLQLARRELANMVSPRDSELSSTLTMSVTAEVDDNRICDIQTPSNSMTSGPSQPVDLLQESMECSVTGSCASVSCLSPSDQQHHEQFSAQCDPLSIDKMCSHQCIESGQWTRGTLNIEIEVFPRMVLPDRVFSNQRGCSTSSP